MCRFRIPETGAAAYLGLRESVQFDESTRFQFPKLAASKVASGAWAVFLEGIEYSESLELVVVRPRLRVGAHHSLCGEEWAWLRNRVKQRAS